MADRLTETDIVIAALNMDRAALESALVRVKAERDALAAEALDANNEVMHSALRAERQRVRELETALRGLLDARLQTMPGVNADGSVSTDSMAVTLARAALAPAEERADGRAGR